MNHITSINEPFPTPQALSAATRTHAQSRFRISTRKLPISKAGPIEDLEKRIGIPMPEMIFGDNAVWVTHAPTGWTLGFSAAPALDAVDKTGEKMLKVAYARDWESTREGTTRGIKEVVKPYDWSYSTEYDGTVEPGSLPADGDGARLGPAREGQAIPLELLKRRDPMLFFDEVVLYESELDDNGISIDGETKASRRSSASTRPRSLRLTRSKGYVVFYFRLSHCSATQMLPMKAHIQCFQGLQMSGRLPDDVTISLRDPNVLDPLLKLVEQRTESITLKPSS